MNRQERRKLSRNASNEEIFPGGHGPIQSDASDLMLRHMRALEEAFPGFHITLFVAERESSNPGRLPRFNYASTADRRDMLAVLRAFLVKHEALGDKLDKIEDQPPTEQRQ